MLSNLLALTDYSMVVPTFFRLTLFWYLTKHAWNLYKKNELSITSPILIEIFKEDVAYIVRSLIIVIRLSAAVLLFTGIFVPIGALMAAIVYSLRLQTKVYRDDQASADIMLIIISLSLLFLGAGAYAVNFPL